MAANYSESRDSSGLIVVALNDRQPAIFVLAAIIVTVPTLAVGVMGTGLSDVPLRGRDVLTGFLTWLLIMAAIAAAYFLSRKEARIIIDTARRVLRLNKLTIPLDQILRAELAAQEGAKSSGPGGPKPVFYRVDLVLRSGKRVPTIRGFGQFAIDDCHRLVDLINDAAGTR